MFHVLSRKYTVLITHHILDFATMVSWNLRFLIQERL